MKKLLTSLLCVVMVMTFMPAIAFVADLIILTQTGLKLLQQQPNCLQGFSISWLGTLN